MSLGKTHETPNCNLSICLLILAQIYSCRPVCKWHAALVLMCFHGHVGAARPLRQSPQILLAAAGSEREKFSQLLSVNPAPSSVQWPLAAMAPPPPSAPSSPSSRSTEAERRPAVVVPSWPIKAAPPLVPLSITARPRLTILVSYYSNTQVCGALSTPLPVRVT